MRRRNRGVDFPGALVECPAAVSIFSGDWPSGPDHRHYVDRLHEVPTAVVAEGARGPVLDVAAGDGRRAQQLAARGLATVALDRSGDGFAAARARDAAAAVAFVRGDAQRLPFRSRHFDRVLCESALDYFDDPGLALREMARVTAPTGKLIVGAVNYRGVGIRLSRAMYRAARRSGRVPPGQRLFWDTPVPIAQSFECNYDILIGLCGQHCHFERAIGLSIGWGVPGWGDVLARLPGAAARTLLRGLDGVAAASPRLADYVLTVWRPRVWE